MDWLSDCGRMACTWALAGACLLVLAGRAAAAEDALGERTYQSVCIGCHQIGVLGAPKFRDAAAWRERFRKGLDTLALNAMKGVGKMPPKGGSPGLTEADLRAAIQYMAGAQVAATKGVSSSIAAATLPVAAKATAADAAGRGGEVVRSVCKGCHEIGVLGAPKIGNRDDWAPRLKKGEAALVQSALNGIRNMPPKGGNPNLTEDDLRAAIRHMIAPPAGASARVAALAPVAPRPAEPQAAQAAFKPPVNANRFNRLLRPAKKRNPPPVDDGIHDPNNDGTLMLQPPRAAFESLPKSSSGNYVDWVKSLEDNAIKPRWDLKDPSKAPLTMELNIVREVKGSMPNVVYPHKQHLEWLDCSNCHPSIFEPRKGANQISMAEILLGRKCGVCHGKVAFPVSECRRCHSQKKSSVTHR